MNQDIITQVLNFEQAAGSIVESAKEEAHAIVIAAEQTTERVKAEMIEQARAQASQLLEEGKALAEANRVHVLQKAEDQANDVKNKATQQFDNAVTFILDRVKPGI